MLQAETCDQEHRTLSYPSIKSCARSKQGKNVRNWSNLCCSYFFYIFFLFGNNQRLLNTIKLCNLRGIVDHKWIPHYHPSVGHYIPNSFVSHPGTAVGGARAWRGPYLFIAKLHIFTR